MIEYILDRTITKRPCIYKKEGNALYPVMYLEKAKGATDEDFEMIIKFITHKHNEQSNSSGQRRTGPHDYEL